MKLTDARVRALPFAEQGQRIVRDILPGFFVVVGRRSKTFTAQTDVRVMGKRQTTLRKSLGRFPDIKTAEARARAKSFIGQYQAGEKHAARAAGQVTLRSAWAELRSDLEQDNRSAQTIKQYRDCVERLLHDWLDVPLAKLGANRLLVRARHKELTRKHGPYAANRALSSLRVVYSHALKLHELPSNPVVAVKFNTEQRRDSGMGPAELPAWFAKLEVLPNPVRRDFHLFMLLSGSRPGALMRARVEHLDMERRALLFPDPKGGTQRAFHLPLSEPMLACLVRAMEAGRMLHPREAETWIFPAASASGHISESKERPSVLPKHGHALRHSFITLAAAAGVSRLYVKLLVNHSLAADITDGYIAGGALFEQVRAEQERLSRFIMTETRKQ